MRKQCIKSVGSRIIIMKGIMKPYKT